MDTDRRPGQNPRNGPSVPSCQYYAERKHLREISSICGGPSLSPDAHAYFAAGGHNTIPIEVLRGLFLPSPLPN
jgi:hypothetical protein